MNITNALKLCRTARGLTQKDLAKKAGMSPSYVSLIEKGKRDVSIATLETLAEAMDIPIEILLFMGADQSKLSRLSPELANELSMSILEMLSIAGSPTQVAEVR